MTERLNQYYHGPDVSPLAEHLHRIEKSHISSHRPIRRHRTNPTPPDRFSLILGQFRPHRTNPTVCIPLLIPRCRDRDPGGPRSPTKSLFTASELPMATSDVANCVAKPEDTSGRA